MVFVQWNVVPETVRQPLVLSTSLGKTFFTWGFILNGEKKYLLLTISHQKPFVVSVPVLCFQILTVNLILCAKVQFPK